MHKRRTAAQSPFASSVGPGNAHQPGKQSQPRRASRPGPENAARPNAPHRFRRRRPRRSPGPRRASTSRCSLRLVTNATGRNRPSRALPARITPHGHPPSAVPHHSGRRRPRRRLFAAAPAAAVHAVAMVFSPRVNAAPRSRRATLPRGPGNGSAVSRWQLCRTGKRRSHPFTATPHRTAPSRNNVSLQPPSPPRARSSASSSSPSARRRRPDYGRGVRSAAARDLCACTYVRVGRRGAALLALDLYRYVGIRS